jgi:hypothetical protein
LIFPTDKRNHTPGQKDCRDEYSAEPNKSKLDVDLDEIAGGALLLDGRINIVSASRSLI